jgi:hypothetical protein
MLTHYLPTLPAKHLINGKVLPPPKNHLERLEKGVLQRNRLAHSGRVSLRANQVWTLLETIEETLWLLQYYSGVPWALGHVSIATRAALGVPLLHWEQEYLRQVDNLPP